MQLSIIIVSWNVREHLCRCLESIYQYTVGLDFEVWVVDNASVDGSADMVQTEFPSVHLVRNSTNRGFAAANNQAARLATGDCILFLNDDTELQENIFPTLLQSLTTAPATVALLGCTLRHSDGSIQPSVRRFPTWFDQTVILFKLHHVWPALVRRYQCHDFDYTRAQPVDQIMGAFMLGRRAVLEQVQYFDEGFFVWFEEVDLQKRLQQLGYTVMYSPAASCVHAQGKSFVQLSKPQAQRLFNRSMRHYFKKHHSWLAYAWITLIQPISLFLAYAIQRSLPKK